MAERSEARKREAKLRVKLTNFRYFWREASLRIFSFASLSHFKPAYVKNKMDILPARVKQTECVADYKKMSLQNLEGASKLFKTAARSWTGNLIHFLNRNLRAEKREKRVALLNSACFLKTNRIWN